MLHHARAKKGILLFDSHGQVEDTTVEQALHIEGG